MAIKAIIGWLGFHKAVEAPPEVRAQFKLFFEDLLIGTLSVADSHWKFEYSSEFKKHDELRPLIDFPDVDKIYESKELWQFFVMRIPSPEQAEVEEILKREHIREDDAVSLRNTVLYIARSLKEHTLLQAIARVNRLFEGKDFGYIIDYYGVLGELNDAMKTYDALDGFDSEDVLDAITDMKEEVAKLPQYHSNLWDVFKTVANKKDTEALERFLEPEDLRGEFYESL